jgi:hypothetical protein
MEAAGRALLGGKRAEIAELTDAILGACLRVAEKL